MANEADLLVAADFLEENQHYEAAKFLRSKVLVVLRKLFLSVLDDMACNQGLRPGETIPDDWLIAKVQKYLEEEHVLVLSKSSTASFTCQWNKAGEYIGWGPK